MPQKVKSVQGLHCLLTESSFRIRIEIIKKISRINPLNGNGLVLLIGVSLCIVKLLICLFVG